MPDRKSLFLLLATIFALSPLNNGAILEKRPVVAFETPNNVSAPGSSCVPWATCNLFFPSVNVYYWPQASPNTACLSADPPIISPYPDISNIQSPSVYAVFPSIHGGDGCNTIGTPIFNLTTSFAIGELSTVGLNNSTYSFNFGDLPCPPADVEWDPSKGPYAPKVAPPSFLFELDPTFANCIPGAGQGIDPPTTLTPATAVPATRCKSPPCHPHKMASKRAHLVPWAPEKTAEPTS